MSHRVDQFPPLNSFIFHRNCYDDFEFEDAALEKFLLQFLEKGFLVDDSHECPAGTVGLALVAFLLSEAELLSSESKDLFERVLKVGSESDFVSAVDRLRTEGSFMHEVSSIFSSFCNLNPNYREADGEEADGEERSIPNLFLVRACQENQELVEQGSPNFHNFVKEFTTRPDEGGVKGARLDRASIQPWLLGLLVDSGVSQGKIGSDEVLTHRRAMQPAVNYRKCDWRTMDGLDRSMKEHLPESQGVNTTSTPFECLLYSRVREELSTRGNSPALYSSCAYDGIEENGIKDNRCVAACITVDAAARAFRFLVSHYASFSAYFPPYLSISSSMCFFRLESNWLITTVNWDLIFDLMRKVTPTRWKNRVRNRKMSLR